MHVVGIDENGLGPRLGPLIATAVTLEVDDYDAARWLQLGRVLGIDDSKRTSGFGRMGAAESLTLAVAEQLVGQAPSCADTLLAALSLDTTTALRAGCPDDATAMQCWSHPLLLPALGGSLAAGRQALSGLHEVGVQLVHARTVVVCAGTLNRQLAAGDSKLQVDLQQFERLLLDAQAGAKLDVAYCGMVGGIRNYRRYLRQLTPTAVLQERDGVCAYRLTDGAELRFEVDADARHLPVALASMIGKTLRELGMQRQMRFYRQHDPSLPSASGYHDPVTARFVHRSASLRQSLAIAHGCFERRR